MGLPGAAGANRGDRTSRACGSGRGAGCAGANYQGDYSSVENYALGDVVLWQGTSYTSLLASNHGNTPGL